MKNQVVRDSFLSERLGKQAYAVEATSEALAALGGLSPLPNFVSCKCPANRGDLINAFEDRGFRYVETALRYEGDASSLVFPETSQGLALRDAVPDDAEAVRSLARSCLTSSRFHSDSKISGEQAARIKEDWAGNFFSGGRGDGMVVAERGGEVAGFALLLVSGATITVDLIAVGRAHRNRGVGKALLLAAVEKFPHGEKLSAGTQAINGPAVRLYEGVGMRFQEAVVVLHCHQEVFGA